MWHSSSFIAEEVFATCYMTCNFSQVQLMLAEITFRGRSCLKFGQNRWCLRKGRWYSLEAAWIHPWCMMVGWIQSSTKVRTGTRLMEVSQDRQTERKKERTWCFYRLKNSHMKMKAEEGEEITRGFSWSAETPTLLAFTVRYFRLSGSAAAQVVLRRKECYSSVSLSQIRVNKTPWGRLQRTSKRSSGGGTVPVAWRENWL